MDYVTLLENGMYACMYMRSLSQSPVHHFSLRKIFPNTNFTKDFFGSQFGCWTNKYSAEVYMKKITKCMQFSCIKTSSNFIFQLENKVVELIFNLHKKISPLKTLETYKTHPLILLEMRWDRCEINGRKVNTQYSLNRREMFLVSNQERCCLLFKFLINLSRA